MMRMSDRQLYVVGRVGNSVEVSSALLGFSYDTLTGMDQDNALLLLVGAPCRNRELGAWNAYCAASNMDGSKVIDVSDQVWSLALAMNGESVPPC